MEAFRLSAEKAAEELGADLKNGLSKDEAARRLQKYGGNRLAGKKKKSLFMRFLEQFKDVMILILIAAAIVSFIVAANSGDAEEFFEPILILAIVILNAIMGVVQESKAEAALDALKSMSAPHAKVVRDGAEAVIDAAELVPGDIILVEAGDFIPADARLIDSAALKAEESALTGESVPSEKDAYAAIDEKAAIGDRKNMIFSGCSITYGRGRALVTATGMETEMGRIAGLLSGASDGMTPLQKKLAQLGKYLGIVALAACAVIFVIGFATGTEIMEMFMTSVSLAVSAIPEGLPAIVTIVLSLGVQRMVKKNAIIRRLPAVETLGSASIICSDKTGTLTQNRMTLVKAYVDGDDDTIDIDGSGDTRVRELIKKAALCCDGSVVIDGENVTHIGDPTETCIVLAAHNMGMDKADMAKTYERVGEIPFESDRKLMTTINMIDGRPVAIVKGALESMEGRCSAGDMEKAKEMSRRMSENAIRVLAVATRELDAVPQNPTSDDTEKDLTLIGLVGMIDPPRPEVREAVKVCKKAGIRPIMITGDQVVTASAIARDLGILNDGEEALSGVELDAMDDMELDRRVEKISVYARVSPENKIRIVRAWQAKGQVVSMTGDGVNDAPALKAADIGCAMGITGTDVAKGAADMTLTDDNFTTIVDAVKEGRGIYDNIKKVVGFLLGTNIGEVLTVFFAMIFWQRSPLLSMQLLMINLVTDSLPAVALGVEKVDSDVMSRKPKPVGESIFAHGFGLRIVLQGVMFGLITLVSYKLGEIITGSHEGGQTCAFITLSFSQLIQAYNMRSEHSLFKIGPFSNASLNKAMIVSLALILAVVFIPPVTHVFGLIAAPLSCYLIAFGLGFVPLIAMEISKATGLIRSFHEMN